MEKRTTQPWQSPYPIIGLAPMDGVTDAAFRLITARLGKPDLIVTEFTSVEGIRAGATRLLQDFLYHDEERPILAQVFGADPTAFRPGAAVAAALGFDGVDINMGCPAKNVAEKGAGAGLIRDPERAKEIIRTTKQALYDWQNGASLTALGVPESIQACITEHNAQFGRVVDRRALPVSVKTRIGYDSITIEEWVQHLLETEPVAITVHGRTLKQLYTGSANWDAIGAAARIIRTTPTLALGNGDISSMEDARTRIETYGLHGALIGRACFGNPWLFQSYEPSPRERLACALEHTKLFTEMFPESHFVRIRKHLLDYCKGWENVKDLRIELMRVTSYEQVESIITAYCQANADMVG